MILRSKAKIVEKDVIEGACRKGSQLQVFTASFDQHHWCMQHCQKLGGRSPPVTTLEEWETMVDELEAISSETFYDYMWTSATEGDKDGSSSKLSHWPPMEEVDGNSVPLESLEGVWRDYYTGQRLTDFEKPYDDAFFGEDYNCLEVHTDEPWSTSWNGIQCHTYENVCPCQYTQQPVLVLRGEIFWIQDKFLLLATGTCPYNSFDAKFTPKQPAGDPENIFILGDWSTTIKYNNTGSFWVMKDQRSGVIAVSRAPKVFLVSLARTLVFACYLYQFWQSKGFLCAWETPLDCEQQWLRMS